MFSLTDAESHVRLMFWEQHILLVSLCRVKAVKTVDLHGWFYFSLHHLMCYIEILDIADTIQL